MATELEDAHAEIARLRRSLETRERVAQLQLGVDPAADETGDRRGGQAEASADFWTLFHGSPVGIMISASEDERILEANDAAMRSAGP